jgi:hypothetical protein
LFDVVVPASNRIEVINGVKKLNVAMETRHKKADLRAVDDSGHLRQVRFELLVAEAVVPVLLVEVEHMDVVIIVLLLIVQFLVLGSQADHQHPGHLVGADL